MQQRLRTQIFLQLLTQRFWQIIYTYLHPLLGADEELSLMEWQLITAIHDEGDGLTLCEWQLIRLWLQSCLFCYIGFAWPDRRVTFKVLWSFFSNLINIHQGVLISMTRISGFVYSHHSICVERLIVLHNEFTQSHFLLWEVNEPLTMHVLAFSSILHQGFRLSSSYVPTLDRRFSIYIFVKKRVQATQWFVNSDEYAGIVF
jgi:hypothetical protein